MAIDRTKIEELERELAAARGQFLQEEGQRYTILMRELPDAEKERLRAILDERLTERSERLLFELDVPQEETRRGRPAREGKPPPKGNLVCDICGKGGFTPKGLALHKARLHKGEEAA
jgi:hypothetical protein